MIFKDYEKEKRIKKKLLKYNHQNKDQLINLPQIGNINTITLLI